MGVSRFRVSDRLWAQFRTAIPPRVNTHRFGGGRPRADDRACLDGIFFVLRTGCQWNALRETDLCPSSTANDRFREWVRDGTFERFFHGGVEAYDELVGIDWRFLSMDGAMTKAPLGGGENQRAPIPPTAPKVAANAACWSRPRAYLWPWSSMEPTSMT
jgi:putative transposase